MNLTRDQLLAQLAKQEKQLAEFERQRAEARARLEATRDLLSRRPPAGTESAGLGVTSESSFPSKPIEKIELFRSLFRGREDVFPTRFVSKKTSKPGYAPACANKFVRGVCDLPRIKCGDCPNQAFLPFSDQAILDHLQGRHVMGVYPLLSDETCWFLAVDFDKAAWKEDVASFAETCRSVGVPVAVERSRSGNGAHAWFFFVAPLPATIARKMGCFLITETMVRRHQLSMSSYDRLFPNQDTMPRGGFGNLIALPLQQDVRQLSMFLGIDEKEVGQIGGGKRKANGKLDVAMIQSVVRKDRVDDVVATYGHVIVDECHHVPAVSFERVLSEVKARFVLGLTATPQRRDGHHPILPMQLGSVRFSVDPKSQAAQRPFEHKLIVRETGFRSKDPSGDVGTLTQYAGRLHRLYPRKREVRVFDYVDREVPLLMRMFEKRLLTYRAIGYARGEAPLGLSEPVEEHIVEYDEEALRHFDHAT